MSLRPQSRARRAASPARDEPKPTRAPAGIDLFAPPPDHDPAAADPAALSRAAILASGRAMKARLWAEARALVGLALGYARLADRGGPPGTDVWGPMGPDEAAFEAVRRKVLGMGPDQPIGPGFSAGAFDDTRDGPDP